MNPLTIFPRHPSAPDTYYINGAWAPAAITAVEKRFRTAELAAEFHSARADYEEASNHPSGTCWTPLDVDEDNTAETALKRSTTFLHFLLRPHHDEDPA